MERAYLERNATERARLRALVERLSDDDLAHPLGDGWTVAATLAHVAFWDRFVAVRWTQAMRQGMRIPPSLDEFWQDPINETALAEWLALPPRVAAQQSLEAAEAVERLIAGLDDGLAEEILAAGRVPLLDRTHHWRSHIDEIERALDPD